jgi:ParB family transcriptional regulator, chromosome partitioning protein
MADRGLGKGLDALIPTSLIETEFDPTAQSGQPASGERVEDIAIELIEPNPHQPRQMFDDTALSGLAESIKTHGILQPLIATRNGAKYQLIAGERRFRAAKLAGLKTVPLIVRSESDQRKLELALLENIQRQDLNPIETATAYKKLIDQFNLTVTEVAKRAGKDQSTVSNSIRLLNLPLEAKRALASGKITEGAARQILAVPAEHQQELLDMIIQNKWNTKEIEAFVRSLKETKDVAKAAEKSSATNAVTRDLEQFLGTKVLLQSKAKGKGRLIIEYYSEEELNRIYETIKRQA